MDKKNNNGSILQIILKLSFHETISLVLGVLAISSHHVNAQHLSNKDVWKLQAVVSDFLKYRDSPTPQDKTRNSELIIMCFETDSNSNVSKIHLLADTKNTDSTYAMLSRMTVVDFKKWHPENCKNKVIIMPVYSAGQAAESRDTLIKNNYADIVFANLLWAIQRPARAINEQHNTIIVNPYNYQTPGRNTIHLATDAEFKPRH